jgi:hypothetical protein
MLDNHELVGSGGVLRKGVRVVVRGRPATFVKRWGVRAAVVRYDDAPDAPKVVPLEWVSPGAAHS